MLLKNNLFYYIICLLLIQLLTSCDKQLVNFEDIDIKTAYSYDIVINGFLSSEKSIHKIELSKPSPVQSTIETFPIDNAEVYLTCDDNIYTYIYSGESGIYQSKDSINGEAGKRYTINVIYNGKYYSASDIMVKSNSIIDFPINEILYYDGFIETSSLVHNFGYNIPSVWTFTESTDLLGNLIHFNITDLNNLNLYNHVGSIPQGIFPSRFKSTGASGYEGDSLEIIKMSVSDSYYNYLVSYFNITDWSSGIFSTIPGNTLSNVNNGGTGYFYATEVKRFRITYKDLKAIDE